MIQVWKLFMPIPDEAFFIDIGVLVIGLTLLFFVIPFFGRLDYVTKK
jgi:hypothetical protein